MFGENKKGTRCRYDNLIVMLDFKASDYAAEKKECGQTDWSNREFNKAPQTLLVQVIFSDCVLKSDKTGLLLELSE